VKKSSKEASKPHTKCSFTASSHLSTLVSRFLSTIENVKLWNQLNELKGETELRHHVSNIIEYTFFFHSRAVSEQEVENLVHLLEKGGR